MDYLEDMTLRSSPTEIDHLFVILSIQIWYIILHIKNYGFEALGGYWLVIIDVDMYSHIWIQLAKY